MRAFARFLWEFVVGDDPLIAAGVVVALGLTALVAGGSVAAWWILPVVVAGVLVASVWRAGRESDHRQAAEPPPERVDDAREALLSPRPRM